MAKGGSHLSRNGAKVSYATMEAAEEAARVRSVEWRCRIVAYECKRGGHFHIGNAMAPAQHRGPRFHEAHDGELGARVVGCLLAENHPSRGKRLTTLSQRTEGAVDRALRAA